MKGVDALGKTPKGKGVYQFVKKYGANVDGYCRNPSFGLATKAKGLQGCGPRRSRESHHILPGV